MKIIEKKVSAERGISPLLENEMELLTSTNARGKVSRKVSEGRGLGMASPVLDHNDLCVIIYCLLRKYYPKYYVGLMISLDDPKEDALKIGEKSRKYVEFDVSVWMKKIMAEDLEGDDKLDDCLVGIEVEKDEPCRCRDLKKIKKAFSYSSTLKEIFLYKYKKGNWVRLSRKNDVIIKTENCSWSDALGVDMQKLVQKRNKLYELIRGLNID